MIRTKLILILVTILAFIFPQLLFSSTAQATLINRGLFAYDDGAGHTGSVILVYDDDFDITWVGDGNFSQTTGFDADGRLDWDLSVAWASGLIIGGFSDFRLPTAFNQDGSGPDVGFNVTGSELGHLFYGELGGTAGNPILSSGDPDLVLFPNLQNLVYWFGEEVAADRVWNFDFGRGDSGGDHSTGGKLIGNNLGDGFALVVRSGDVAFIPIPEPSTFILLLTGLVLRQS